MNSEDRQVLPVEQIVVGERARKDDGDLTDLVESIREHGVLQPIGVLPGNRLLFGGRRLEACRRLGLTEIPVTYPRTRDDALAHLKAERDENTCRKDMTPEEIVDVGLRIEQIERPRAKARQGTRTDLTSGSRDPEVSKPTSTAREVGAALGLGDASYKRAKHVVQIARGETKQPADVQETARQAMEEMNTTGKIMPAYRKVAASRKEAAATEASKGNGGRPSNRHVLKVTALRKITANLSGYQIAITDESSIDPKLADEEADRMAADLSKSIAALRRLYKLLTNRERIS